MCKLNIFIYTDINHILILNEKSLAISSNILYIDINFIKKEFDFGMIFDKYIFSIPKNLFGMYIFVYVSLHDHSYHISVSLELLISTQNTLQ